uniref:Uncharacterized protein n=1 Tax=Anguilla anguilla TaxID=7936 RepID=A0A0E9UMV6_ANGAN
MEISPINSTAIIYIDIKIFTH